MTTSVPPRYGPPISLDLAKRVMAAAEAEATKQGWSMAIAIVDSTGHLTLFQRIDQTQFGSVAIAIGKAETAVNFRRSTKALEDGIAAGGLGLRLLAVPGITPLEGGVLLLQSGAVIGAIGASGMQSTQDGQVAQAGAAAIA